MNVTEALSCLHLVTTRGLDQVVLFFCKLLISYLTFDILQNYILRYLWKLVIRLYDTNDNDQGEEGAVVLANALAQLVHEVGQNSF